MAWLVYDGATFTHVQADVVSKNSDAVTVEVQVPRDAWDQAFEEDD
jgi:hypothetical protein